MYVQKCLYLHNYIETGGIMITPRPSTTDSTPKPGYPMTPFFGVEPVLMSDAVRIHCASIVATVHVRVCLIQGKEITDVNATGNLCIKKPWPSMARTIYGNHEKFLDTYYHPYSGKISLHVLVETMVGIRILLYW